MDRNICEDGTTNYTSSNNYCRCAWYKDSDDNTKGPVTAITVLYNGTKDWNNVPNIDLSDNNIYTDERNNESLNYGYGEIGTTNYGIYITEKNVKISDIKNNQDPTIPYDEEKKLKSRLPKYYEVSIDSYKSGEEKTFV